MTGGLEIGGRRVQVPGARVVGPGDEPWAKLDARDYALRETRWPRQIIIHTTKGKWPQTVRQAPSAGNLAQAVADFWRRDPEHSAAQIVIDDEDVACLCDLLKVAAHHATTANPLSIGIEMYQHSDGSITEATLRTTVEVVKTICDELPIPIPFQGAFRPYNNLPLKRMIAGQPGKRGLDCVGVFGHRDVAWDFKKKTSTRGRGDPGDIIFSRLMDAGMIGFDYDSGADLAYWSAMQSMAAMQGAYSGVIDGVCGPATIEAMRKLGRWRPARSAA